MSYLPTHRTRTSPAGSAALRDSPHQLCNIDFLRGIAALIILFWHYQHFYFPQAGVNAVVTAEQPLFGLFAWFYLHGAWAVQFFWILSGFVFFHVYAGRRDVSLRNFFGQRFSRLYPLHVVTLCLVAALQFISWQCFGQFQIYPLNDLWHFVLNLFMASHWGLQSGWSFNAPIWSISVELLVYAMFFGFLKTVGVRPLTSVLWLAWSLLFYKNAPGPIFECATLFALGGVVNQVHAQLVRHGAIHLSMSGAAVLLLLAGGLIESEAITLATGLHWGVFPALIWLAAALDLKGLSTGRLGVEMGTITYSSYLLHVPLQILLIMVLDGLVGSRHVVASPVFLIAYLIAVIGLARLAYRFIEHPLKLSCRQLLAQGPKVEMATGR